MTNDVPQHFDRAFLRWFQERTEETWQNHQTRTLESYLTSRMVGDDWQPGTRWLNGLGEQEIVAIEQHYQLHFPPDYRLFLQMLHSVDRPRVGVRFTENNTKVLGTSPSTAPRLIPVFAHRYLLAEPCEAGNPVFSIYQSDMIIYGEDLHSYFLHEFWDLLGIERPADGRQRQLSLEPYRAIPFWGEILWGEF